MTWRAAHCLLTLRDEINAAHPDRDKSADGIIASAAHHQQNPNSDHEPDSHGVVHAIDITTKPGTAIDADRIVEKLRLLGKNGDPRLAGTGYVIYKRRIASAQHAPAWEWHPYTGSDPHEGHFHLSCTRNVACDTALPWNLYDDHTENDMTPEQEKKLDDALARATEAAVRSLRLQAALGIDDSNPAHSTVLDHLAAGGIDYDKLAKAVNDDAAKRLKD